MVSVLAALVVVVGLASSPVAAENTVESSSPNDGGSIEVSPEAIVIVFTEPLGEDNTISVDCDGEPATLARPEVIEKTTLSADVVDPLPSGTCTARWLVSNSDGEPDTKGVITFVVQTAAPEGGIAGSASAPSTPAATDTSTTATVPSVSGAADGTSVDQAAAAGDSVVIDFGDASRGNASVWLTRLISTLGVAVLFGALVVITAAWPEGIEYLITIKFLRTVWVVAAIGTVLFTAFAAAAVTPDGGGSGFSPGTWTDLLDAGWSGRAVLLRLVFTLAAGWVAFKPERAVDPSTQLVGIGLPGLAVAMIGISRTTGDLAALGVLMGVIHALAMAVWVGGVILLARVVLSGPGEEDLIHAVRGFARISTPAIAITIVTGLVQMFRLDGGELFQSGHGRVVILKTVVVAAMIFVAFSARQFVAQRLNRAHQMSAPLADRLRRAFGAEAGIGIATLVLSAWLLAFTPPNVQLGPTIGYDITQTHTDASGVLDVRIRLTDRQVGLVGMEVEVVEPKENLAGLTIVLIAPPNDQNLGSIRQPVPLAGAGYAVRAETVGLPISIAGDWTITVEASTANGAVSSTPQTYSVTELDGSSPTTAVTVPQASLVELPPATDPTVTTGG